MNQRQIHWHFPWNGGERNESARTREQCHCCNDVGSSSCLENLNWLNRHSTQMWSWDYFFLWFSFFHSSCLVCSSDVFRCDGVLCKNVNWWWTGELCLRKKGEPSPCCWKTVNHGSPSKVNHGSPTVHLFTLTQTVVLCGPRLHWCTTQPKEKLSVCIDVVTVNAEHHKRDKLLSQCECHVISISPPFPASKTLICVHFWRTTTNHFLHTKHIESIHVKLHNNSAIEWMMHAHINFFFCFSFVSELHLQFSFFLALHKLCLWPISYAWIFPNVSMVASASILLSHENNAHLGTWIFYWSSACFSLFVLPIQFSCCILCTLDFSFCWKLFGQNHPAGSWDCLLKLSWTAMLSSQKFSTANMVFGNFLELEICWSCIWPPQLCTVQSYEWNLEDICASMEPLLLICQCQSRIKSSEQFVLPCSYLKDHWIKHQ